MSFGQDLLFYQDELSQANHCESTHRTRKWLGILEKLVKRSWARCVGIVSYEGRVASRLSLGDRETYKMFSGVVEANRIYSLLLAKSKQISTPYATTAYESGAAI